MVMNKTIVTVLFCMFVSTAFAAEQSTFVFGLKWGDSKEVVSRRMRENNLTLSPSSPFDKYIPEDTHYSGKILGYPGSIGVGFADNKLVKISIQYNKYDRNVPFSLFNDLRSALIEKYGEPSHSYDFSNGIYDDLIRWKLKNINTEISLSDMNLSRYNSGHSIFLSYNNLKHITEVRAKNSERDRKETERRTQELKRQL